MATTTMAITTTDTTDLPTEITTTDMDTTDITDTKAIPHEHDPTILIFKYLHSISIHQNLPSISIHQHPSKSLNRLENKQDQSQNNQRTCHDHRLFFLTRFRKRTQHIRRSILHQSFVLWRWLSSFYRFSGKGFKRSLFFELLSKTIDPVTILGCTRSQIFSRSFHHDFIGIRFKHLELRLILLVVSSCFWGSMHSIFLRKAIIFFRLPFLSLIQAISGSVLINCDRFPQKLSILSWLERWFLFVLVYYRFIPVLKLWSNCLHLLLRKVVFFFCSTNIIEPPFTGNFNLRFKRSVF